MVTTEQSVVSGRLYIQVVLPESSARASVSTNGPLATGQVGSEPGGGGSGRSSRSHGTHVARRSLRTLGPLRPDRSGGALESLIPGGTSQSLRACWTALAR